MNKVYDMNLTSKAKKIFSQINSEDTKLGDLRKMAKEIKKDHELAMELWSSGGFLPRQLAILIMDKKKLTQDFINKLDEDMKQHVFEERNQLADWLMANQLTKETSAVTLIENWEHSPSAMQRRIFWYYQARLRWTGQNPPNNTEYLLTSIENMLEKAEPEVQWAMNFTAAQIGVFDPAYRSRCIALGERIGLYKDEVVPRGCTPSYLPEFIKIQTAKLKK